jgi:hypothetical protein
LIRVHKAFDRLAVDLGNVTDVPKIQRRAVVFVKPQRLATEHAGGGKIQRHRAAGQSLDALHDLLAQFAC